MAVKTHNKKLSEISSTGVDDGVADVSGQDDVIVCVVIFFSGGFHFSSSRAKLNQTKNQAQLVDGLVHFNDERTKTDISTQHLARLASD